MRGVGDNEPMPPAPTPAPWARVTRDLPAPLAVVDLPTFDRNAEDLSRRAGGVPIRVASKSVRVPELLRRMLERPGTIGVMAYSLREAIWLVRAGLTTDVLLGYPAVDPAALAELAADPGLRRAITLMIDDAAHLDLIARAAAGAAGQDLAAQPVRVCLDIDASLRIGRVHIGARRSPLRTPEQARRLAADAHGRPGIAVRGLMFYEAQVAGVGEAGWRGPIVRGLKRLSLAELATRRASVVRAVEEVTGPGLLVNGGGSGSVAQTTADPVITEVTAGSGLFVPTLFDHYAAFTPRPAAFFGLDVVRRPAPGYATAFAGGYIASGAVGSDRWPAPLAGRLTGSEGAGEVQTPLRFGVGREPAIGDRVWFRHAKAGEAMERFDRVHLVDGADLLATVATYRGEGLDFG
ncbi:amino acid deaminase/aldolase [Pseudactinotalea sp. HY158]|nr:amino acid deaminase/aldolase [Pseudactinotalea sp. HY158]